MIVEFSYTILSSGKPRVQRATISMAFPILSAISSNRSRGESWFYPEAAREFTAFPASGECTGSRTCGRLPPSSCALVWPFHSRNKRFRRVRMATCHRLRCIPHIHHIIENSMEFEGFNEASNAKNINVHECASHFWFYL